MFEAVNVMCMFDRVRWQLPLFDFWQISWLISFNSLTFYLILFRTCRGRAGKLLFKNCKDFYLAVLVRSCSCLCHWNFFLCLPKTPGRFKKAILLSGEDWSLISKQANALPEENGDALREEPKKMTTFSSKLFACILYALCFYWLWYNLSFGQSELLIVWSVSSEAHLSTRYCYQCIKRSQFFSFSPRS